MNKNFIERSYRLTDDRTGLAYFIKTGKRRDLLIFDKDKGFKRPIRHCPSEPTIYADDIGEETSIKDEKGLFKVVRQTERAKVVPIIFVGGYLTVGPEEQVTQNFLANHPSNISNGGSLFEMIDEEQEAEESLELDELRVDIYNAVRSKAKEDGGEYALESLVAVLENSVAKASEMGIKSLKRRIYQQIDLDPNYFVDDHGNVSIFEDDYVSRKYFVLRALSEQVIKKATNKKSMLWVSDGSLIASAPRGVELTEYFTDFLSTDEGMLVAEEIKNRS